MKLLESKNLLLRVYTQNIDGLEMLAGLSPEKLVECHGHFSSASCIDCGAPYDVEKCKQLMLSEPPVAPMCETCGVRAGSMKGCCVLCVCFLFIFIIILLLLFIFQFIPSCW